METRSDAQTAPNAFRGHTKAPSARELAGALGRASLTWERLLSELAGELGLVTCEWGSSSIKLGWSLRVKKGDRVILYMTPLQGRFRVSYALGEGALRRALASGLPAPALELIHRAKRYAEGTAVRLDVVESDDLETVKKLARAKLGK